jgi:3-hydroxyisobutyrate dehydrogenase-like beta-hydroxyacid dehydrogenase
MTITITAPASANTTVKDAIHTVAIVGLGNMGSAFARNLLEDGISLLVYDRDPARSESLAMAGAQTATDLSSLASADVVITSLPNDKALEETAMDSGGLTDVMKTDAVHISMSTVSPGLSSRLAEQHAHYGQGYVAAPVLGNPDLAAARNLFLLVSGDAQMTQRVAPLLSRLGQRLFQLGEGPAVANVMKLACNVLTAQTMQGMGEVLALLRKKGLDPHVAFEVLTGSLFDGKVHKTYGGKIVDEPYSPAGMTTLLAVKDLRLALAEAEAVGVPMPSASLVHDRLVAMTARGWSTLDWSALGRLAALEAGLSTAGAGGPQ